MQGKQNKMGVMPIPKLLLSMAVPLMLSLLVQSLYNIVDSIYVSAISEKALTATSLAYPVQILMIALGVGTAVGINALLSRLLGQKNLKEVSKGA
ncbi:MAG: MATE family efflux transporter, partial [Clostridia bacterium]|nr:MATE family efflux transporter [Clostridia bacterium]